MRKKDKTILFLTILVFGLFLTVNFARAQEATPEEKALEIVYPQIPGVAAPKVISIGLPEYIEYIFRFSIWLIGFVILGALIYAGFQYFTSFGNPEKFSAAKSGIISAFLGGIILLGAVLIFNTINPQLVILEAPPLDILEPTIMPGIYLCNKKVDNVVSLILDYTNDDKNEERRFERRLNAVKEFMEIMHNNKGSCFQVPKSDNLKIENIKKFEFDPKKHTIFAIPREDFIKGDWVYDYGIIFHEKDNFQGNCVLGDIYGGVALDYIEKPLNKSRSVTLFQKPEEEPGSASQGVILYQCLDYNQGGFCPEGVKGIGAKQSFKPDNNLKSIPNEEKFKEELIATFDLKDAEKIEKYIPEEGRTATVYQSRSKTGTRSIKIDPVGSFFAVLFDRNDFRADKVCEVISADDPNLLDNDIGKCGNSCRWTTETPGKDWLNKNCIPCLKSMIVVKGNVIK